MAESTANKPIEKVQESAQQAAKAETTSRPTRQYRTYLFQFMLIITTGAFALLTFLVKTTPSFPIDLAITRFIQSINFPFFDTFMYLVSWPGFPPQSFILSLIVIVIIY